MKAKIKNMLRLFLDSIRDYEHENGERVTDDERESSEFVDTFLQSEDAFDYRDILEQLEKEREEKKRALMNFLNWHDSENLGCLPNGLEGRIDEYLSLNESNNED